MWKNNAVLIDLIINVEIIPQLFMIKFFIKANIHNCIYGIIFLQLLMNLIL